MKRKSIFLCLWCVLSFSNSYADLLIDPANGTILQGNGTYDNVVSSGRSLGFTGLFFGASYQAIDVSTNGNLNFSSDTASNNTPIPTSVARISPLWDDLVVSGSSESVSEKRVGGLYYAVTWQAHESGTGADVEFQATLFGAPTQIGSFKFLAGDIAFSYASVSGNFSNGDATVGLDRGNSTNFAALIGQANGDIKNGQVNLLPTNAAQFMLFRPNGTSYDTFIDVVPEPSSIALCAGIAVTLCAWARCGTVRRGASM